MTKDEIIARLAHRLADDVISEMTWSQLALSITSQSATSKAALLNAVQMRHASLIGPLVLDAVRAWAKMQASTDVSAMLTNDTLSLDNVARLLKE